MTSFVILCTEEWKFFNDVYVHQLMHLFISLHKH